MKFLTPLWLVTLIVGCNFGGRKATTEVTTNNKHHHEGYVDLTFRAYSDIDEYGNPSNAVETNDSSLVSTSRRMYLYDSLLLDVMAEKHFVDGRYIGMDTSYYAFFNLSRQRFIFFDTLATHARIKNQGLLEDEGSFSTAKQFDPLNGVSDSSLYLTDTLINDRRILIAKMRDNDTSFTAYAQRTRFWIDSQVVNFPLQLSYSLSRRTGNAFVYKRQLPMPDGKAIMVVELRYLPAKLPQSMVAIFEGWTTRFSSQ